MLEEEKILETDIQRQILDYLKALNIDSWRQNNIGVPGRRFTGLRGVHDILGFYWPSHFPIGLFMTIEVKLPKEKMSDSQINFQNMILKNGHISFKATSIEDVKHELDSINSTTWQDWLNNTQEKRNF